MSSVRMTHPRFIRHSHTKIHIRLGFICWLEPKHSLDISGPAWTTHANLMIYIAAKWIIFHLYPIFIRLQKLNYLSKNILMNKNTAWDKNMENERGGTNTDWYKDINISWPYCLLTWYPMQVGVVFYQSFYLNYYWLWYDHTYIYIYISHLSRG